MSADDVERRARKYREVLGQYPTGVSAVTSTLPDGTLAGMTVGSFTSVSLDPPLVAFFPTKTSSSWPKIERSGRFCVNVLAWDQEVVCQQMARKAGDKFADLSWTPSKAGLPVLDGAVAWIDCVIDTVTEAGDHYIVVGAVEELEVANQTLPLVFFRGGYGRFSPGPLVSEEYAFGTHTSVLETARIEMLRLGSELDVESAVTGIVDDEYVLVASTWTPMSERARVRVGDRVPATPPLAVSFIAYEASERQNTWVENGVALNGGAGQHELVSLLEKARENGWVAGVANAPRSTVVQRLMTVNDRLRSGEEVDEEFNLSAPVFNDSGEVVMSLSIYGMGSEVKGKTLTAYVDQLLASTRRIAKSTR